MVEYGWDQTPTPDLGLDITKAPADIQKLYRWVIQKRYGQDVASAYGQGLLAAGIIAKNAEAMSLFTSGQMDTLDQFVKDTLIELTDKDIISAPEIIFSRDGEETLSDRLNRDLSLVNDKMAQTTMDIINGTVEVSVGNSITTNGFYEFGNTYRYLVTQIEPGDTFLETNKGFQITKHGDIKISSSIKLTTVITDSVKVGSLGCNDDNDDVCFQAALSLAVIRDCNVDVDVDVDISGSIDVYRDGEHSFRKIIEVTGRGKVSKHTGGYLFVNTVHRTGGNLKFNGIHFRSTSGVGMTIFAGSEMLRIYFENCHFLNVDQLTKTLMSGKNNYLQTIYVSSSTIVGGEGWFIDAYTAYDVSFTHSIVEHREAFAKISIYHSVRITDNLIEGIPGKILEVGGGRSLVFDDNYMEWNGTEAVGSPITIDNPEFAYGFPEMMNFSFQNNLYISVVESQRDNPEFYLITIKNYLKSITIKNNFCDCNFLKVTNKHTIAIQPNELIEVYGNNVINAKNVLNNIQSPKSVSVGSGNVLSVFRRPMSISNFVFFNSSLNTAEVRVGSKLATGCQVGKSSNRIGFQINNIVLETNTNYALGIAATIRDVSNETSGVSVVLRDVNLGTVLWEDTMDVKDIQLTTGYTYFYNLKPLLVSGGNKTVNIEVFIAPRNGGNFASNVYQELAVSNLVIQRGHVATDFVG